MQCCCTSKSGLRLRWGHSNTPAPVPLSTAMWRWLGLDLSSALQKQPKPLRAHRPTAHVGMLPGKTYVCPTAVVVAWPLQTMGQGGHPAGRPVVACMDPLSRSSFDHTSTLVHVATSFPASLERRRCAPAPACRQVIALPALSSGGASTGHPARRSTFL